MACNLALIALLMLIMGIIFGFFGSVFFIKGQIAGNFESFLNIFKNVGSLGTFVGSAIKEANS